MVLPSNRLSPDAETASGGASRRVWTELVLVLLVFSMGTGLGMARLVSSRSPEGLSRIACPTTFFARPLMIAAGRGAFHPDLDAVPGLLPFLERRTATFDPATLPMDIPVAEDSAAEYHLYLGWSVASLWRAFGISWLVLEPFLALALGLCALCAYGLFRLGMNRWLSLAGTALFVSSPAVLDQLNNLRDFSKAPFLLAGIFAIGWLATRKAPLRFLWLAAALMGLIAGVGMGFRQDAIILVPASLAAILFLSSGAVFRTTLRRAGAALVYLLFFLAAASPMLTRMEGGAQPYHPLAQGYSMRHTDRCSLAPGMSEPLACSHDNYVFATIFAYARRTPGNDGIYFEYNDPEDSQFTRDWVIRTGLQYPADTIARGYGAVLNMLAGADIQTAALNYHEGWWVRLSETHRRIAAVFRTAGLPIAVLALLTAAAASHRIALVLVLLLFYFCGYVSLDNEWRHTFHLSFVGFWAAGFLLQQLFSVPGRMLRGTAQWGPWLCRAGVFLVVGVLVLWLPWLAACSWQRNNIETLRRQYAAAPRAAVATKAVPLQDWTFFRMRGNASRAAKFTQLGKIPVVGSLAGSFAPEYWDAYCALYAVRLRGRQEGHLFLAKYWGGAEDGAPNDFTQVMRVAGGGRDGGETWFFFPAYDFTYRTVFEGVAFAREDAGNFLGLYRVADEAQPLLLPCLTLHEPGEPERLCAGLETPCDPMRLFTPENEWVQIAEAGVLAERMGRLNEAVFYTRVANALRPSSEMAGKIALLYEQAGQTQNTLRVLESAVVSSGGDITSCIALEKFLGRKAREFSAPSVWEQLVRQMPTIPVWQAYERSLDEKEVEKRLSVLRQLLRVAPEDGGALLKLQKLLVEEGARMEAQGDLPGAVKAYREAIPLNPRNNEPVLCLEKALSNSGPAERQSVWEAAWADNRDNPHVATLCGAARAASGDLAGAKEAFDTARRLAPEEWYYHVLAADALAAAGAWADAAAAYGRALAINPKLDYLRSRLDEAETRVENETRPPESAAPPPAAP